MPHSRTTLYLIIAVLLALLFAVGAIAAYYVGRADGGKTAQLAPRQFTPAPNPN